MKSENSLINRSEGAPYLPSNELYLPKPFRAVENIHLGISHIFTYFTDIYISLGPTQLTILCVPEPHLSHPIHSHAHFIKKKMKPLSTSTCILLVVTYTVGAFTFSPSSTTSFKLSTIQTKHNDNNKRTRLFMTALDYKNIKVMVNGMPGPMATAAAEACLRKGLSLSPIAMTGPDVEPSTITVHDTVSGNSANVKLIPSTQIEEIITSIEKVRNKVGIENFLAIDYTHPSAVNYNAMFYAKNSIPFVMGTTGGDRGQLMRDMENAKASAVIAPNMGKQIVALQAGLEDLAKKFPSAFGGYKLHVRESHQKTKADTSGTAKAVVDSLKVLSDEKNFTYDDIEMIRDDQESLEFGVKDEHLKGHAFHTYTLTSPDGSVEFQLKHNVSGRTVYAEGTADAIKFLAKKISEGKGGLIYSMINVLEEGAME
jgi:4-hydroxy-tetrahydrodipicolinate reductase